jgi:hypothetical protein
MLLVGCFEGLSSQRGIAWRCCDSLSLRDFLGIPLAYKAEHVVDLESEIIVAAEIYHANQADSQTLEDSVQQAQTNLREAGSETQIKDVMADKGYHANETLAALSQHKSYRTYIPEPALKHDRTWTDKPPEQKAAVVASRRRTRGERGRMASKISNVRRRKRMRLGSPNSPGRHSPSSAQSAAGSDPETRLGAGQGPAPDCSRREGGNCKLCGGSPEKGVPPKHSTPAPAGV